MLDREDMRFPDGWSPDLVSERLVMAVKLCARTVSRPGPSASAAPWPAYAQEWGDLLAQIETNELGKGGNRVRLGATSRQITLMEEAIRWPGLYLSGWPGPLRCLNMFLFAKAHRVKFNSVCKRKGIPLSTAKHGRAKAISIIAQGLQNDGIEVRL